MVEKDPREWIRIHNGLPEHPKVEGLSDTAFRLLIELWCYCSRQRNDGTLRTDVWVRRGASKARTELIDAGLVDPDPAGGYHMHDYPKHQLTAEEISVKAAVRIAASEKANHVRWHTNQGVSDPDCGLCSVTDPNRSPARTLNGLRNASASGTPAGIRSDSQEVEVEEEKEKTPSPAARVRAILTPELAASFDEFWAIYPRKVGKLDAQRKFATAVNAGAEAGTIVAGATLYAASALGSEERFIAHPATWLHQGRWTDEPIGASTPPWGVTTGNEAWMNV